MRNLLPFSLRSRLGLSPVAARGERIYAIGDIHGRLDLLLRILARIEADHMSRTFMPCRLIFLGDFIDRGPQSAEVMAKLQSLSSQSDNVTILMGNHESTMLASAAGDAQAQEQWLTYGGDASLKSFGISLPAQGEDPAEFGGRIARAVGEANLEWIDKLPLSTRSGDYFFCHAGVRPYIPLERQDPDDLLFIRSEFLDSEVDHGAVIVHGHSIVAQGAEFRQNRINVDSGAYRTGRLTAVGLEGPVRWLVEAHLSDEQAHEFA